MHPGGSTVIVANAGRDVTYVLSPDPQPIYPLFLSWPSVLIPRCSELFRPIHPPDTLEKNLGPENYKGVIDPIEAAKVGHPLRPHMAAMRSRPCRLTVQATEAYEAEKKKVDDARAALPDAETMLSLDELQVSRAPLPRDFSSDHLDMTSLERLDAGC